MCDRTHTRPERAAYTGVGQMAQMAPGPARLYLPGVKPPWSRKREKKLKSDCT